MLGFLSKMFKRRGGAERREPKGLGSVSEVSNRRAGRREPPSELDWSQAVYVPLPPSPPTWEVDGREEFHRDYNDPSIGPVLQAGLKHQHTKVVKLAGTLSPEQRQGRVGEVIAKAYVKLIMQRIKSGQLAAAAKQCIDMFESVPEYVKDADRRRFNRVLKDLDKLGKKHDYVPVDLSSVSSVPLFELSEAAPWGLAGERKLKSDDRPDPAYVVESIDRKGAWLLDRAGKSAG